MADYGAGSNRMQMRYFTNVPISSVARVVGGFWGKPCIVQGDSNKYDFMLQWEEPRWVNQEERLAAIRPVIEKQLQEMGWELEPSRQSINALVVEPVR